MLAEAVPTLGVQPNKENPMRVLSVRFKSTLPLRDLEAPWREVADEIAGVPGLLSRT
jgi:hypothetical protein